MTISRRQRFLVLCLLAAGHLAGAATDPAPAASPAGEPAQAGRDLYAKSCAFCHGREAAGGESGPDLTHSAVVTADNDGDKIFSVVRNGRPGTKMPAFDFSTLELQRLTAYVHVQAAKASKAGARRSVDVADLQTGEVAAGRRYFTGSGTCATCHSATGDLAGVATRYQGLQLEQRMLYPRKVKSHVTVSLASGETLSGVLEYLDEFTLGMRDAAGMYRSWNTATIHYSVDAPVSRHIDLLSKYTDADIHNLMAYLQTLK